MMTYSMIYYTHICYTKTDNGANEKQTAKRRTRRLFFGFVSNIICAFYTLVCDRNGVCYRISVLALIILLDLIIPILQTGQILIIIRIIVQALSPLFEEALFLTLEALLLLVGELVAAGLGLVVMHADESIVDDEIACGTDLEAEVDVVVGDDEVLVKAADLVEYGLPYEHAGGGDTAYVL